MAKALDLQEQEQLEEFKAFWNKWGNLITWLITAVLLVYAGYNAWNYYKRTQAAEAAALFEELDRAAIGGDADKAARIFNDLKSEYPGTAVADQGALLAAKALYDGGKAEAALGPLTWAADHASVAEHAQIAALRMAGLQAEAKQFDAALQSLSRVQLPAYAALAADRRGDVLLAQGKAAEAVAAWRVAYDQMDPQQDYRRLIEAKLMAQGAAPEVKP